MEAETRVGVLVEVSSVEIGQSVRIGREVGGHPVEDHAYPCFVQSVDQQHQVLGIPVPSGRSEIAGRLIAP